MPRCSGDQSPVRTGRAAPARCTDSAGAARPACCRSAARPRACRPARGSPAGRNGRWRILRGLSPCRSRRRARSARRRPARSAARCRCARAPECFSALVSASRPMRSRWCSSTRRGARGVPSTRTCAATPVVPSVICRARSASAPARSRLSSACDAQVHDRAPRFLQAVAQHLPRHVERLLRAARRRLQRRRDRLELQRDARQALLERVVQLAPDARPLGQHRLVLLALAPPARGGPERRARQAPSARIASITARMAAASTTAPPRAPTTSPRRAQAAAGTTARARLVGVDAGDCRRRCRHGAGRWPPAAGAASRSASKTVSPTRSTNVRSDRRSSAR